MPAVLTLGSMLLCAHGGRASPTVVAARVLIGGQAALAAGPLIVAGCANPPPPAGTGPCITAQFLMTTTRVRSAGLPLLIESTSSICVPTGTPLTVAALQTRVSAQ